MIFTTFTGREIDPLNLKKEDIDIVDIAVSLSRQCRFAGHCRQFYSVAEHSVLVTDLLKRNKQSLETQKYGLLHDATEAYICDIPKPFKIAIPEYKRWEFHIWQVIKDRFNLNDDNLHLPVRIADDEALNIEMYYMFPDRKLDDNLKNIWIWNWKPLDAQKRFLTRFSQLFPNENNEIQNFW